MTDAGLNQTAIEIFLLEVEARIGEAVQAAAAGDAPRQARNLRDAAHLFGDFARFLTVASLRE